MAMKVGFVQNLADVVNPVERYLNDGLNPDNPFERQVLLVPLIGVRSWLTPILATRLGATNEHGDGVLANVDVQYTHRSHPRVEVQRPTQCSTTHCRTI